MMTIQAPRMIAVSPMASPTAAECLNDMRRVFNEIVAIARKRGAPHDGTIELNWTHDSTHLMVVFNSLRHDEILPPSFEDPWLMELLLSSDGPLQEVYVPPCSMYIPVRIMPPHFRNPRGLGTIRLEFGMLVSVEGGWSAMGHISEPDIVFYSPMEKAAIAQNRGLEETILTIFQGIPEDQTSDRDLLSHLFTFLTVRREWLKKLQPPGSSPTDDASGTGPFGKLRAAVDTVIEWMVKLF